MTTTVSQMTTGEMHQFTKRFQHIINLPEDIADQHHKNVSLAALMDDLEKMYHIPMQRNEDYEKEHPELMQFYRTVSAARSF